MEDGCRHPASQFSSGAMHRSQKNKWLPTPHSRIQRGCASTDHAIVSMSEHYTFETEFQVVTVNGRQEQIRWQVDVVVERLHETQKGRMTWQPAFVWVLVKASSGIDMALSL